MVLIGLAATCSGQERVPTGSVNVAVLPSPFHVYLGNIFGAPAIARAAMFSLLDDRWGPESTSHDANYLRHFGLRLGESAISETTKSGIAAVLHQDPSFTACECRGLAGRVRHASIGPFMARTREGRSVFSVANVAGLVVAQLAAGARDTQGRGGMRHVAVGVAGMAAFDLLREFVPQLHK